MPYSIDFSCEDNDVLLRLVTDGPNRLDELHVSLDGKNWIVVGYNDLKTALSVVDLGIIEEEQL